MLIELVAVDVAKIVSFADPQDHALRKTVEPSGELRRRRLGNIPGSDRALDRLDQGILPDTLQAAEYQGVIDFVLGALQPVRQPAADVFGVLRVDPVDMDD